MDASRRCLCIPVSSDRQQKMVWHPIRSSAPPHACRHRHGWQWIHINLLQHRRHDAISEGGKCGTYCDCNGHEKWMVGMVRVREKKRRNSKTIRAVTEMKMERKRCRGKPWWKDVVRRSMPERSGRNGTCRWTIGRERWKGLCKTG